MAENIDSVSVVVVDSSFLISTMFPDENVSSQHNEYLSNFRSGKLTFVSCELLKYEIYNCLKSAILQSRIDRKRLNLVEKGFNTMKIEYQAIDFKKTFELCLKYNLSFYDASYLYLAKMNRSKLLTLDKKLASLVKT